MKTKSQNIKILDCTLRDGGYVNNWDFGYKNITGIIRLLTLSKADFIECGYLKNIEYDINKSIFSKIQDLLTFLPNQNTTIYTFMLNYGEYSVDDIPYCETKNIGIRVAFRKKDTDQGLDFCEQLKNKGYLVFINPMITEKYSEKDYEKIIARANKIKPYALSIVDSFGALNEQEIINTFEIMNKNLDKNIAICFHSHNNMQLSFLNAQTLIEQTTKRELIIDSTVFGIGRGAGNMCTEILMQYMNTNYHKKYSIEPIIEIIDKYINKIPKIWGYSLPYYFSAKYYCHPNYAKYLIENNLTSAEEMDNIFKSIPQNKKDPFDEDYIAKLCKSFDKELEFI